MGRPWTWCKLQPDPIRVGGDCKVDERRQSDATVPHACERPRHSTANYAFNYYDTRNDGTKVTFAVPEGEPKHIVQGRRQKAESTEQQSKEEVTNRIDREFDDELDDEIDGSDADGDDGMTMTETSRRRSWMKM
eukprot:scpid9575/ scgid12562/ 